MVARVDVDGVLVGAGQVFADLTGDFFLDVANDLFSFVVVAVDDEPAWALGDEAAEEQDADAEDDADSEGEALGDVLIDDVVVEENDSDASPKRGSEPVGGVDDEVDASPEARWDEFVDGGVDGGVLAADTETGDEAELGVAEEVPGEGGGDGRERVNEQGDGKELLAAQAVGGPAKAKGSDDGSAEIEGGGLADLGVAHMQGPA